MGTVPLRSLVGGSKAAPDRAFYTNLWFRGHTNRRYQELLPRLARVDTALVTCSNRRLVRAAQYRALMATAGARHRVTFALAQRRYSNFFSSDLRQLRYLSAPGTRVVLDLDDPRFTPEEIRLLASPALAACVVTTDEIATHLAHLGVNVPCPVVPQGVAIGAGHPGASRRAQTLRRPGEFVAGYMAAYLGLAGDGVDPVLYRVDHLLELWDRFRLASPRSRLWLVGEPGEHLVAACRGRDDVLLLGRLPPDEALAHLGVVDIALYPRRADHIQGGFPIKVAEYLGLGVPVVGYDLDATAMVKRHQAGLVVEDPAGFVQALETLACDPPRRAEFAANARTAGADLDWGRLAQRYARLLDEYLPVPANR